MPLTGSFPESNGIFMKIREVYERYTLMLSLQQHMLRVTGVVEVVGLALLEAKLPATTQPFSRQDVDDVLTAMLLHDMGNMAKFKLEYFPDFVQPEGLAYWQDVQQKFWSEYGKNAHAATLKILDELAVSERVKELVDAVSFNKAKKNLESTDYAKKLCAYSDMRVGPHGVIPLEERFKDGQQRYEPAGKTSPFTYAMAASLRKIEKQLFEPLQFCPEDVTDKVVQPFMVSYLDRDLFSV